MEKKKDKLSEVAAPKEPKYSLGDSAATTPKQEDSGMGDLMSQALIAFAPALIGSAFGGTEGALAGSKAGQAGLGTYRTIKEAEETKSTKAQQEKMLREGKAFDKAMQLRTFGLKEESLDVQKQAANTKQSERHQKVVSDLRKERNTLGTTKNTQIIGASYNRIKASVDKPSPAGDLSLIFNYMKMLDPNSVVRESEFRTAAQAGSVPEQFKAQINKIMAGEMLSTAMRKDFVSRADKLYKGQLKSQATIDKQFIKQAKRQNIDPNEIIINYFDPEDAPPAMIALFEERGLIFDKSPRAVAKKDKPPPSDPQSIGLPEAKAGGQELLNYSNDQLEKEIQRLKKKTLPLNRLLSL